MIITLACLFFVLPCSQAAEKTQYKLKLRKGQSYRMQDINEKVTVEKMEGQQTTTKEKTDEGYFLDIKSIDEHGNAWIEVTYKWIKSSEEGPDGKLEFDSSKTSPSALIGEEPAFAALEEVFLLKVSPKGKVEQVDGLEMMYGNILKKINDIYDSNNVPDKELTLEAMKIIFSQEVLKEMWEETLAIYPSRAVGIGDSWSKTIVKSYYFASIEQKEWILKDRNNGVATFEVKSIIEPNLKAEPLEVNNRKIRYKASGKRHGFIKIDEATGIIIRSEIKYQLSGHVDVDDGLEKISYPFEEDGKTIIECSKQ
jgi:hypothetical protein